MSEYQIKIEGTTPLIMHSAAGLDERNPLKIEVALLAKKKGTNRTEADIDRIRECECLLSIWWDEDDKPTIPSAALRSCIETAARKLRQGPQVREGLTIFSPIVFDYDKKRYGSTVEELARSTRHTVPVVVQRNRIMRTRARFSLPWSCMFNVELDDELADKAQLMTWLDIAGRRIGLGDWRPEKSGEHGRFKANDVTDQQKASAAAKDFYKQVSPRNSK